MMMRVTTMMTMTMTVTAMMNMTMISSDRCCYTHRKWMETVLPVKRTSSFCE